MAELTNDVKEDWIREYRTIRLDIIYTTAAFHMVTFFFDLERRFTKMKKSFTVKSTLLRVIVGDAGFEP